MIQGTNNGVEFFIISRIFFLAFIQFLIKESNRLTRLAEHNTNSHTWSITINFEQFVEIWKYQNRSF